MTLFQDCIKSIRNFFLVSCSKPVETNPEYVKEPEPQLIQQYSPGTQENYNSFSSKNSITKKDKELEYPEGTGGGKGYRGHEVASTLRREAPLRVCEASPGVPPTLIDTNVVELVPVIDIDEYADLPDLIPIPVVVISNNTVEEYQTDEELIIIANDSDDDRDY
jgi:hypothetical protein